MNDLLWNCGAIRKYLQYALFGVRKRYNFSLNLSLYFDFLTFGKCNCLRGSSSVFIQNS